MTSFFTNQESLRMLYDDRRWKLLICQCHCSTLSGILQETHHAAPWLPCVTTLYPPQHEWRSCSECIDALDVQWGHLDRKYTIFGGRYLSSTVRLFVLSPLASVDAYSLSANGPGPCHGLGVMRSRAGTLASLWQLFFTGTPSSSIWASRLCVGTIC